MNTGRKAARKSVLILGGGVMQLPAIRAARQKGWRVIVADANPSADGAALADLFVHVDLKDTDGMLRVAREELDGEGLDGVFTAGTDFSATVARVAEALNLPGIPYETALRATDKELMRRAFSEHGVPSPRFAVVGRGEEPTAEGTDIPYPLVVKPVDSMGARGVRRVDSPEELRAAVREAVECSRSSRAIVEEYLEGPEFSIDALVIDGEIVPCGIADRHIRFAPYFVEMGHTLPSAYPADAVEEVMRVFRRGVRALGVDYGAAKGDIKLTPSGAVVGEIAARLSGGYMSGWTFPLASGVDLTAAALDLAAGLPPGNLRPARKHVAAERAFISIPGIVREIRGIAEARAVSHIRELFLRIAPGDRVYFPRNNVQKCGNVIASCAAREEAAAAAERAVRAITIRLVPGEESTARFLYDTDAVADSCGSFPPHAFALRSPGNRTAVDGMPPWRGRLWNILSGGILRILPLPELDREESVDWHGADLRGTLERLFRECGLRPEWSGSGDALGSLFWRAVLRGGLQGGLWLVDTLADGSTDPERRMNAWLSRGAERRF